MVASKETSHLVAIVLTDIHAEKELIMSQTPILDLSIIFHIHE